MTYQEAVREHGRADASGIRGYRADIDGLRCIAVLLVVLFHFGLPESLRGGFVGVDVFFVISGYLIVPPIVKSVSDGLFSFRDFYERRVRRLAPALITTLALTTTVALLVLTPAELVSFVKEASAAQLYVSNIYYWRFLNYFGLQANQSFLLHTWSLGVEEQFYLTAPLLLFVAHRCFRKKLLWVILLVGICSFALNLIAVRWKPEAAFYLLPTRAWEFSAGALVPQFISYVSRRHVGATPLSLLGGALVAIGAVVYEPTTPFPGSFALLPVSGTVLLLAAGADARSVYSRLMSTAIPRYIGRISYELYLVHWPVKIFLPLLLFQVSVWDRVCAVGLSFLISAGIYHIIESPIRSRRWLTRSRALISAYAGGTGALLAIAFVAIATNGIPARLNAKASQFASAAEDFDARYRDCEARTTSLCTIGDPHARPTWIIYGDSHADALAGAFNTYLAPRNKAAYFSFYSACLPIVDAGDAGCTGFNRSISAFIGSHPEIRNVVLVSTWTLVDGMIGDRGQFLTGSAATASFLRSFDQTLAAYRGRQVIVWLRVPGARSSVPAALARNAMWGRGWDLRFTRREYDEMSEPLALAIKRHPEVITIDPAKRLCKTGRCDITSAGRPLYFDNAHPAASQRAVFGRFIQEDLARVP